MPDDPLAMMPAEQYVCWCDGDTACTGRAREPFGLCDECQRFGHGTLPRRDINPEYLLIEED